MKQPTSEVKPDAAAKHDAARQVMTRHAVKRTRGVFLLSLIALLLVMPGEMLVQIRQLSPQASDAADLYSQVMQSLYGNSDVILLMTVLAVLSAMVTCHYLHNRVQTGFYHSIPVRRSRLLLSRILAGILNVVPAYVLALVVQAVMCAVTGNSALLAGTQLLQKACVELGFFLIVYAISVFACVLTGGVVAALTVDAFLQCAGYIFWCCLIEIYRLFYPAHLLVEADHDPDWLSPFVMVWTRFVSLSETAQETLAANTAAGSYYAGSGLVGIMRFYVPAAVVILALAVLVYRIRRSERTGTAIAFRGLRLPVKYLAMTLCAILLGVVLYSTLNFLPMLYLGMAAGAILAAVVTEMLFDLDITAVMAHQKSLLVYLVLAAALVLAAGMDVTGYNTKLPDREDIVSASLYSSQAELSASELSASDDLTWLDDGTGENTWIAGTLEDQLLNDRENVDSIYAAAQRGAQTMKEHRQSLSGHTEYDIEFKLKDGSTFVRSYYLASDEKAEEYNVLTEHAADVRFSEEYTASRTSAALADPSSTQALLVENSTQAGYDGTAIQDADAIQEILKTVKEESQSLTVKYVKKHPAVLVIHTVPKTDSGFAEQLEQENDTAELWSLDTDAADGEYNIPVYVIEEKTVDLLQKQGVRVARFDQDQIQQMQLVYYPDREEQSLQQTLDASLEESEAAQSVTMKSPKKIDYALTGAVSRTIVEACDPIVRTACSDLYDAELTTKASGRVGGTVPILYLDRLVPDDLKYMSP